MRKLISRLLQKMGVDVESAENGVEAVARLAEKSFDRPSWR